MCQLFGLLYELDSLNIPMTTRVIILYHDLLDITGNLQQWFWYLTVDILNASLHDIHLNLNIQVPQHLETCSDRASVL